MLLILQLSFKCFHAYWCMYNFLFREVQTVVLSNIATMSSTRKVMIVYGNAEYIFFLKYNPDKYCSTYRLVSCLLLMYIILIKFRACDNMITVVLDPKLMFSRHLRSGHLICLFCPTQCGYLLLLTFAFPANFFFVIFQG